MPARLICSSASSMPCLSCAPKYEPGPDIGSNAPILMTLSSARTAADAATTTTAAIAARANRGICSRIVMVFLRAHLEGGKSLSRVT